MRLRRSGKVRSGLNWGRRTQTGFGTGSDHIRGNTGEFMWSQHHLQQSDDRIDIVEAMQASGDNIDERRLNPIVVANLDSDDDGEHGNCCCEGRQW